MNLNEFIQEESQTKFLKEPPKVKKESNKKVTVCFNSDENDRLRKMAGEMPLSIFIKNELRKLKII